ncbi:DUF3800 domain-containing protein [Chitinimonas taiwanensis]|uniref:DUF3800 domain-containing protein n=1 Tax=Chitinimonas taiwanensis TaxID=240412 RepID=UPI0035AFE5CB
MTQNIYFDESGFTGNNLLHPDQKYFAYGSVATDDAEAAEFVAGLIEKYGIQGGELKGSKLVKFNKGRKAIDEIFTHFEGRIKVSLAEKKYALACKFFEYIFEPCISEINSTFYGIGFHKYIANIMYCEFMARGAGAEEIFQEFENIMRNRDTENLEAIFSSSSNTGNSPILKSIREFAQHRFEDIRDELMSLKDENTGKWILDLTGSALFTLLANWGKEYDQITAFCDNSKPLQQSHELFNLMVNRSDHITSSAFGEEHPLTFNLSEPLVFSDSRISHGIQLADAVAAAMVYSITATDNEHAMKWKALIPTIAHYGSIFPDLDMLNLKDLSAQRNAVVLLELHERAKNGIDLIDGMPEYIRLVSQKLLTHPMYA